MKANEIQCEQTVSAYPLRIAGGFPCFRPAKYLMEAPWEGGGESHVCGMHRNVLLRQNWVEKPALTDQSREEKRA